MSPARLSVACVACLLAGCVMGTPPPAPASSASDDTPPALDASSSNVEVFDAMWSLMLEELYDTRRVARFLTEERRVELRRRSAQAGSRRAFARDVMNPFLRELGVSHTGLFTRDQFAYYVLKGMYHEPDLDLPAVAHLGVQLDDENVVRAVLDGFPAEQVGVRRGDRITAVDGVPYRSLLQFAPKPQTVTIERNGKPERLEVTPVQGGANRALLEATRNSARVLKRDDLEVGYIHLWSGTHPAILEAFKEALDPLMDCDAIILDLRDGFGGAWYDHLDLFFSDRSSYFEFQVFDRTGKAEAFQPGTKENPDAYLRPMVVLVNEGTRSGKEGLAYQFKTSGRAPLVGNRTWGAFTAGAGRFADLPELDVLFYLAVAEYRLDGNVIEGVGVTPTLNVHYPTTNSPGDDPQLERALREASSMVRASTKADARAPTG